MLSLEQFNYLSYAYQKTLPLITQFEYYGTTSVMLESKKDWRKLLEKNLMEQSVEISFFLEFQRNIKLLKDIYTFENPYDIIKFLWTNQFLIEILFEAQEQIKKIFGEEIILDLELHHDPEENWDELFIIIKSSYSAEKAVELEKKLFEDWFVYRMDSTKGKLNITEEPL